MSRRSFSGGNADPPEGTLADVIATAFIRPTFAVEHFEYSHLLSIQWIAFNCLKMLRL